MQCLNYTFLLIALLLHTTAGLKSCETVSIDINGVKEKRVDEVSKNNCTLFKDFANKCKSVSVEISLDKHISKFYYTNYGTYLDTIYTNITFYNESLSSSAILSDSTTSGNKIPIIVAGVVVAALSGGAIIYLARYVIKTIMQSGTYIFPDP